MKPCPWCASTRLLLEADRDGAQVACDGCGAAGPVALEPADIKGRDGTVTREYAKARARLLWDRREAP